jgi:hypothetical protein
MHLSSPTWIVFVIALLLGVAGIAGIFGFLPAVVGYSTYLLTGGFALLVLGVLFPGI